MRYYYPGGTPEGGQDGLIVDVSPRTAQSWIGIFAFGKLAPKGRDGLYTWPDPRVLCVVSRGHGYLVRVDEPAKYETIRVNPILDVIPVASRRIVVFANYTELVAYGEAGPVWVSDRLSWDGITITAVTHEYIEGKVWDPRDEADVAFRVDLTNGRHEGGSVTSSEQ